MLILGSQYSLISSVDLTLVHCMEDTILIGSSEEEAATLLAAWRDIRPLRGREFTPQSQGRPPQRNV